MCYQLAIVDYTKRDENNDPMIKLVLGDLAFPSLILGELIVEKVLLDLAEAQANGKTPDAMKQLEEYPVALINIHDGDVTVFSDNRPLDTVSWDVIDRFLDANTFADHTQTRLESASKLVAEGVPEDTLWSSLARFLIVEAPATLGLAEDDPTRLQVLAEQKELDAAADQLADRYGDPAEMSEEQILAAIEEFAKTLGEAPSATDPQDTPPAPSPKGLKIRGE